MARHRLFVAVRPPADVVESLAAAVEDRRHEAGIRWLDPGGWHVTLQFLGHVDEAEIDPTRLACAFGAGRVHAFEAEFTGIGAFPAPRRARVVWIGMGDGGDQMAALSTAIQAQTAKRGFESETREFHPHLTIARLRKPRPLTELLESIEVPSVRMQVDHATLFESHLDSDGARYEVVDTFPLRA